MEMVCGNQDECKVNMRTGSLVNRTEGWNHGNGKYCKQYLECLWLSFWDSKFSELYCILFVSPASTYIINSGLSSEVAFKLISYIKLLILLNSYKKVVHPSPWNNQRLNLHFPRHNAFTHGLITLEDVKQAANN